MPFKIIEADFSADVLYLNGTRNYLEEEVCNILYGQLLFLAVSPCKRIRFENLAVKRSCTDKEMVFELLEIYKIGYKHSARNRVAVYGRCRAVIIVKQYCTLMIVVNIHTDLAGILISGSPLYKAPRCAIEIL